MCNGGHDAFRVTTVDDTGVQYEGEPGNASVSISTYEETGTFWFWPPVPPQVTQLRVTVSTPGSGLASGFRLELAGLTI
jgi:hypothetical protein